MPNISKCDPNEHLPHHSTHFTPHLGLEYDPAQSYVQLYSDPEITRTVPHDLKMEKLQ